MPQEKKPKVTVKQLREELEALGEDTRGSKPDLLARLEGVNARAINHAEAIERGEIGNDAVGGGSDDENYGQMVPVAATTTCEDFYSDDEEDLLPSRKRRRDNCPCYKLSLIHI
eukprot:TRINITY_DN18334_c0_g1_i5.p1 TRINITY_DN18334_c0_g1~~TRINITY_DN18334_c0_g1_i5.p1  ORF type:complete len:114 (+),score=24.55 TRINITY_DN18334_c0_g1_i5:92-433(+)